MSDPTDSGSSGDENLPDIMSLMNINSSTTESANSIRSPILESEIEIVFPIANESQSEQSSNDDDSQNVSSFSESSISSSPNDGTIERDHQRNQTLNFNRIPAINIFNSSQTVIRIADMIEDFRRNGIQIFAFKQLNAERTLIQTTNMKDFERVKNYLNRNHVEYFTYTAKLAKMKSFVLLGLRKGTSLADLKSDLMRKRTATLRIMNIAEYKDYPVRRKTKHMQPFIVQITAKSSRKELLNLNHVLGRNVSWEPFKRRKLLQCHRCQRIGHVSYNCHMDHRCYKCGKSHFNAPCLYGAGVETSVAFCALCGLMGHTSLFRGCAKFQNSELLQYVNSSAPVRAIRMDVRRLKRQKKRRKRKEEESHRGKLNLQDLAQFWRYLQSESIQ